MPEDIRYAERLRIYRALMQLDDRAPRSNRFSIPLSDGSGSSIVINGPGLQLYALLSQLRLKVRQ